MKNKSGIYNIINIINGKIYIGSAMCFYHRNHIHLHHLRHNTHYNDHLQRAFNKYGEENFKFEIIEYVEDKSKLIKREQFYLNKYGAQEYLRKENTDFTKNTYNMCPNAGNTLGMKFEEAGWNKGLKLKVKHINNLKKAWEKRRINFPTKESTKIKMGKSISITRSKPEVKERYKAALLKRPIIVCPYCNYQGQNKGSMMVSHFDNCKLNPYFDIELFNKKKEKLSLKLKAAKDKLPIIKCPYCDKESRNKGNMVQNHFDKCKFK